jgi:hypothetical protein
MVLWLLFALVVAALVAVLVPVAGALFGGLAGGLIGAWRAGCSAPKAAKELGDYRGLVAGGCLGVGLGLLAAQVLLAAAVEHLSH